MSVELDPVECSALIAADDCAAVSRPATLAADRLNPELARFTVSLPDGVVCQLVPLLVLLGGLDGHASAGNVHAWPVPDSTALIALAVVDDNPALQRCFWLSRRSVQLFAGLMFAARLDGWWARANRPLA